MIYMYKVDRDKLKKLYGTNDPENTTFLPIWEKFPLKFQYLANTVAQDGHLQVDLVMVLEDGVDTLKTWRRNPCPIFLIHTTVFTPGILGQR